MILTHGTKYTSVHTEKKLMGEELYKLRLEKKISYHQIYLNTGVEIRQIKNIEEGRNYMMDTYLLVVKFIKHGQSRFRPSEV